MDDIRDLRAAVQHEADCAEAYKAEADELRKKYLMIRNALDEVLACQLLENMQRPHYTFSVIARVAQTVQTIDTYPLNELTVVRADPITHVVVDGENGQDEVKKLRVPLYGRWDGSWK